MATTDGERPHANSFLLIRRRLTSAKGTIRSAIPRRLRAESSAAIRLIDPEPFGYITRIEAGRDGIQVVGWARARRLHLSTEAQGVDVAVDIPRPDLCVHDGANGFETRLPGRQWLKVTSEGVEIARVDLGRGKLRQRGFPVSLSGRSNSQANDAIRLMHPRPFGYIDRIEIRDGKTRVAGWARTARMRLSTEAQSVALVPDIPRPDVPEDFGAMGFDTRLTGSERLVVQLDSAETALVSAAKRPQWVAAGLRTFADVLAIPVRHGRDLFAWSLRGDMAAGRRLEEALLPPLPVLHPPVAAAGLFSSDRHLPPGPEEPVDIIIPVYNAWQDVTECLDRVARFTDSRHRVTVIDDASSDARIAQILNDFAAIRPNARIIRQQQNAGFIASVNRGLEEAKGHVVLLNTDAFVPEFWLERLMAPILADPGIATVSPMTNNGEIANVPVMCTPEPLTPGTADAIDLAARSLDPVRAIADGPTGVGFCMAMARPWLDRVDRFDTVFGRGYGEEVDWCQKTAKRGARHVLTGALFVEHRGGMSFGPEKLQQIARNNAMISARYPTYDAEVQNFIRNDPAIGPRLVLGLARACVQGRLPIYLASRLSGGSDHWLRDAVRTRVDAGQPAVVVRDGTMPGQALVELHGPSGIIEGLVPRSDLSQYLAAAPRKEVICSSLVGARDPFGMLATVAQSLHPTDRLRVLFHDYYPICPSYTLLGADGRFCGLPAADACQACYERLGERVAFQPDTIAEWRAGWTTWLDRADVIEVFSASSRDLVTKVWPDLAEKVEIRPHSMDRLPEPLAAPANERPVVGVLGAIGYEKGADVLRELAAMAGDSLRIVVIGEMDMSYHHPAITVHGRYDRAEISALTRRYAIDRWLFPSICPETYSFAVRECLATGLPVFVFDLGAQAEAARAAPNGIVLPMCGPAELHEALLLEKVSNCGGLASKGATK